MTAYRLLKLINLQKVLMQHKKNNKDNNNNNNNKVKK